MKCIQELAFSTRSNLSIYIWNGVLRCGQHWCYFRFFSRAFCVSSGSKRIESTKTKHKLQNLKFSILFSIMSPIYNTLPLTKLQFISPVKSSRAFFSSPSTTSIAFIQSDLSNRFASLVHRHLLEAFLFCWNIFRHFLLPLSCSNAVEYCYRMVSSFAIIKKNHSVFFALTLHVGTSTCQDRHVYIVGFCFFLSTCLSTLTVYTQKSCIVQSFDFPRGFPSHSMYISIWHDNALFNVCVSKQVFVLQF